MRDLFYLLLPPLAVVALISCQRQFREENEEPLLLIEELDDSREDANGGPKADNSRCHVCHINYEEEELAVVHAKNDIGCEECHGDSSAHCSDEDNITPPDTLFARDDLKGFCTGCHEKLKPDAHKKVLEGTSEKVCTDCHDFEEHRLTVRTRKWDKKTRKLIMSDGVRMMTDDLLKEGGKD